MKLSREIYLNCGIWEPSSMLFIAIPGYFASSAWCESDEEYYNISGRKFEGITADDCKTYRLDRLNIRRLNEDDDLDELLNNSCESFKTLFFEKFCVKNTQYI